MPELGLLELFVIGIVLFLVVGPERMPELFSQLGNLIRNARNFFHDAKRLLTTPADAVNNTVNNIVSPSQINAINAEVTKVVKDVKNVKLEQIEQIDADQKSIQHKS
ncbi:MAG: twin-arginine translocase TatA/TatE family subunit [Mariprofundales bacterium]